MLATDGRGSGTLTFAQIDWDALRALSMERFPSFGKPFSYTTHSGTKVNPSSASRTEFVRAAFNRSRFGV